MTLGVVLAGLVLLVVLGEFTGWPFLAGPLQTQLSQRLDRTVSIDGGAGFGVRFVGHPRLQTRQIVVAAPAWSQAPHLLRGQAFELELRWMDLLQAWQGQRLRIHRLQAGDLDVYLERQGDGRASWTLGRPGAGDAAQEQLPLIGTLRPGRALIHLRDAQAALELQVHVRRESDADSTAVQWLVQAEGKLRQLPVQLEADASNDGSPAAADGSLAPLHLKLQAGVGRARLEYSGTAHDLLHGGGLDGRFKLQGPSLAAVGDPIGVTLPTTGAFNSRGTLVKQGSRWRVQVDDATIGASQLAGQFVYATARGVPLLTGKLSGKRLLLRDLGPVVGTEVAAAPGSAASDPARGGRVLPDRPFDLPALRAMDAQVSIDIDSVDLESSLLEPLRPLRAQLELNGGVLTLSALDASTAQGRLTGELSLDGRGPLALWTARLRWQGLRLERWINQARDGAAPPWVTGQLNGQADVRGQGRSTAQILGSLQGSARTELRGGTVSHLAIEAAGIDVAESLGLMITGDRVLPVSCAVADLAAERGVWRTRVMVLDTADSTVWVDGSVSLASEQMDLRAVVSPKDLSPLSLRSPLRVTGSLSQPVVSVDKGRLGRKLGASLLLGLLNPLAALLPLFDLGNAPAADRGSADCQGLLQARKALDGQRR